MSQHNSKQLHNELPVSGFVRIPQILKVIPISEATWWRWVKEKKAPKGIKLGSKITAWKADDIHTLIDSLASQGAA